MKDVKASDGKKEQTKPYSDEWEHLANTYARKICKMKPCRNCGRPAMRGYWCGFCDCKEP